MPIDWSDDIILGELNDEPELSEELSAIFGRLGGEAPAVGAELPSVVLNLGGVSYLNSSHLAQLLRLRKRLEGAGRTLILCSLGEEVSSVMSVTGLEKIFRITPDPMTALASLQMQEPS